MVGDGHCPPLPCRLGPGEGFFTSEFGEVSTTIYHFGGQERKQYWEVHPSNTFERAGCMKWTTGCRTWCLNTREHCKPLFFLYYHLVGIFPRCYPLKWDAICHRHGRLAQLSLDSFLNFAKSNSSLTLIDLIFLLILSIHVTLILSYPFTFTFILTHSLSFFKCAGYYYDIIQEQENKGLSTRR